MAFDGIMMRALRNEFRNELQNARLSKIQQPEKEALLLHFNCENENGKRYSRMLFLSASPSLPVLYLTDTKKEAPVTAPGFTMLLRKYLGNARLESVDCPALDRVMIFSFSHLVEMGDPKTKRLIVELMGKYSNIILTDENDIIIDSIKRVPPDMSSVRTVLPKEKWFLPLKEGKTDPLTVSPEQFSENLSEDSEKGRTLKDAILAHYTGFGFDSIQAMLSPEFSSETPLSSLSPDDKILFTKKFFRFLSDIEDNRFSLELWEQNHLPVLLSAVHLPSYENDESYRMVSFDSPSLLLERFYAEKNKTTSIKQRANDLLLLLSNLISRVSKKLDLQENQYEDTDDYDTYRIYGELLSAYAYELKDGEKAVTVKNYYDDNQDILIPLDKTLSIRENSNRYYKKYNRLKRTREALENQIPKSEEELFYLRSVKTSVMLSENEADLSMIRDELYDAGYLKKNGGKNGKRLRKSSFLHYETAEHFHLYVGKNNYQNEDLTFHFAAPDDLWFHVKNAPGSHVILRNDGREIPDHIYEIAGNLAAYYSSEKNASKVEVDYIAKRYVKKVPGAPPGFCIYHTNYSLMAVPEIGGLRPVASLTDK